MYNIIITYFWSIFFWNALWIYVNNFQSTWLECSHTSFWIQPRPWVPNWLRGTFRRVGFGIHGHDRIQNGIWLHLDESTITALAFHAVTVDIIRIGAFLEMNTAQPSSTIIWYELTLMRNDLRTFFSSYCRYTILIGWEGLCIFKGLM